MTSKLAEKLHDPEYRKAFVSSQINIGIPFQIRALLKARGWTQNELAVRTGMLQPRISGMMSPGKTRPNIETLRRVAEAFDCGLMVRFVPFSELARWSETFDPEHFSVPTFNEESPALEKGTEQEAVYAAAFAGRSFCTTQAWTNSSIVMQPVVSDRTVISIEAGRQCKQTSLRKDVRLAYTLGPTSITFQQKALRGL